MIKDRLLLAAFSGFLAALAANLSLYLINQVIPGQNINMPQLTVNIFMDIQSYSFVKNILGVIWSTVVGGIYALVYVIALDYSGWRHLWLNAIIIVNGGWFVGPGLIARLLNLAPFLRYEPLSVSAFYAAHLLFATYLFFLVSIYGSET